MSRTLLKICFLVVATLSLSGCDFLRILAGRPTSSDIAAKREQLRLEESNHLTRLDSLLVTQKLMDDSLAFADSVMKSGGSIVKAGSLGGFSAAKLSKRFYIVIGVFSSPENASRQGDNAKSMGYNPILAECRNGNTAVLLCPSDNLAEVYQKLKEIKPLKFCPADVWILNNE